MKKKTVSIILCTRNRADYLERAVTSLVYQSLEPARREVIIVDNGSTDTTHSRIRRLQKKYRKETIRSLYVAEPGLSKARNVALGTAGGQYIAFFDDDAIAPIEWLSLAFASFSGVTPRPLVVGGKIVPLYEAQKPAWFSDRYETDTKGEEPRFLVKKEVFSSSNMIVDRAVFAAVPLFDERIGMKGTTLAVAEETAWFDLVWQQPAVAKLYYNPQLVVHHSVPSGKMTVRYRLARSYAAGNALALRSATHPWKDQARMFLVYCMILLATPVLAIVQLYEAPSLKGWIVDTGHVATYAAGYVLRKIGIVIQFRQPSL